MTQADFTIANQTFPNTRAEINTSIQALATNSAGDSAPSTTFANQWWFDSDGNQLYIRNKDNDAWVKVVTIGATSDKIDSIADSISIASTGGVTITTADNSDTLSLISTDADANVGPVLRLYRNSASAVDNDVIGNLIFSGNDTAGNETDYLTFQVNAGDADDGQEDGFMRILMPVASSSTEFVRLSPAEVVFNEGSADLDFRVESNSNTHMLFVDAGNNEVGINASTCESTFHVISTGTNSAGKFESNSANNPMVILNNSRADDGSEISLRFDRADTIQGAIGTTSQGLTFWTNASLAERMRINSSGLISIGGTGTIGTSMVNLFDVSHTENGFAVRNSSDTGTTFSFVVQNASSSTIGSISNNGSSTAFNTSSDYRLKENVETDWNATTRLKQLKPSRFNFKVDTDTTLDGFLAHEVSSIVPEAITGDKDATETKTKVVVNSSGFIIHQDVEEADWTAGKVADEDGNTQYPTDSTWEASKVVPVYQGIDQSKLVPLLVKTVQELEARIATLEGN